MCQAWINSYVRVELHVQYFPYFQGIFAICFYYGSLWHRIPQTVQYLFLFCAAVMVAALLYEQNYKLGTFLIFSFPPPFFSQYVAELEGFFTVPTIMIRSDLKDSLEFIRKWKCDHKAAFKNPLIISRLWRFLYCYFYVLKYIEFCYNLKFAFYFFFFLF